MSELHTLERPKDLPKYDAPAAFTAANAVESVHLSYPAGDRNDELRLVQIEVSPSSSPSARESLHYRATIELGEGAEAKVLVRFAGNCVSAAGVPRSVLLTTTLDIRLAAHSHLHLYVVSGLSVPYFREAFDRAVLQEGATLEWTTIGFDENNGIYSANIDLVGAESELDLAGAYGAHRNTEQEHIISVHHIAPRTRSRTNLKSARFGPCPARQAR